MSVIMVIGHYYGRELDHWYLAVANGRTLLDLFVVNTDTRS